MTRKKQYEEPRYRTADELRAQRTEVLSELAQDASRTELLDTLVQLDQQIAEAEAE